MPVAKLKTRTDYLRRSYERDEQRSAAAVEPQRPGSPLMAKVLATARRAGDRASSRIRGDDRIHVAR